MKIGIITYHRAHNYGAVLQCYALQELLREMGYDVQVIDYRQPFIEKLYRPSKIEQILKNKFHPRALIKLKNEFSKQNATASCFENFRNSFFNISHSCTSESLPQVDVYIIGSDQMWSIDCVGSKIDPVYFGIFKRPKNSKLIGFSISSNMYSINILGNKLNQYIQNFDNISLREASISDAIYKITSKRIPVTLDPTLCVEAELWNKIIDNKWKEKQYVVCYHVMFRFSPIIHKILLKQTKRIAELHGWDIVDLSTGEYSVSDFVSAIRYAQCVVTSSFHATVFAIMFARPLFAVKLHDGNDGRYVNLLEALHMGKAVVDLDFTYESPVIFDYNYVKDCLSQLRKPSLDYLKSNI